MGEYTREFKVTIYRDTNKDTHQTVHLSPRSAILAICKYLDDDQAESIRAILGDDE
jgi:hypothetical protein